MTFRWLPTEVTIALLAVFAALIVASLAVVTLKKRYPSKDFAELDARVRTWWVIVALFAASLVIDRLTAVVFFAAVSGLALREFLGLVPTRETDHRLRWWAYAAIPLQYLWVAIGWYEMFLVFVPVYVFLALPARALLGGVTEGFVTALSTMHWGVMVTVFSLSHAAYTLSMEVGSEPRAPLDWPSEMARQHPGAGLLVLLILLTQFNDVAQYLWGKSLGRRKVAPSVSPGKTWAGLLGGVATTGVLSALIGPLLTFMTWPYALAAGLLVGVGGFFGDLAMSALKRDLGVKDSGTLLPGHGGVLDRVDSLTYAAPLFFHFLYYFYG